MSSLVLGDLFYFILMELDVGYFLLELHGYRNVVGIVKIGWMIL